MSSSSWTLSLAPNMSNSTLNSAQLVCFSKCRHSSCLFMKCLFEQLDRVGVSVRPHVNIIHWQRSCTNLLEIRTVLHQVQRCASDDLNPHRHILQLPFRRHISCMLCIIFSREHFVHALHHLLVRTSPACSVTSDQVFHSCRDGQALSLLP